MIATVIWLPEKQKPSTQATHYDYADILYTKLSEGNAGKRGEAEACSHNDRADRGTVPSSTLA